MKKIFTVVFLLLSLTVFSQPSQPSKSTKSNSYSAASTKVVKTEIRIQPLGEVRAVVLDSVKSSLERFYKVSCKILKSKDLTPDILAASKTRYSADKILDKFDDGTYKIIITEVDIACKNEDNGVSEWGVFGLGYMPGKTCVVSTFRLGKNVPTSKMIERLQKISIHEVGHNLGLDHCTGDPTCLMEAAGGTIKTVDRETFHFCKKCLSQTAIYRN